MAYLKKIAFSLALTSTLVLTCSASSLASEPPRSAVSLDLAKIGEAELVAGIKLSDLGELAPHALDLVVRGFPPIAVLRDLFRAGRAIKDKIDARAQRAEDVARIEALNALLVRLGHALAEEADRQEQRHNALVEDNRKTHAALAEANSRLAETNDRVHALEEMLRQHVASNAKLAAAWKAYRDARQPAVRHKTAPQSRPLPASVPKSRSGPLRVPGDARADQERADLFNPHLPCCIAPTGN